MGNDLNALFENYYKTHEEYARLSLTDPEPSGWDVKRYVKYVNGPVIGKYREEDADTLEAVRRPPPDAEIRRVIREHLKSELRATEKKGHRNIIDEEKIELFCSQLEDLETSSAKEWSVRNFSYTFDSIPLLKKEDSLGFLYLYFAYEEYRRIRSLPFATGRDHIDALYGIAFPKESQFQKYGLLPVDGERELLCLDPPRVYDRSVDKTLYLKNVPLPLAEKLKELLAHGEIGQLSVRVCNDSIFDGRYEAGKLLEEVERGKVFTLANLGTCEVTRLYSKNYEDCLWVTIDRENITFEELSDDFTVQDEQIVTQLVHLQYVQDGGGAYITHLDHEFVFYTMEEFLERKRVPNQKGTAHTRVKSFKIDRAHIPFDLNCTVVWRDEDGNDLPPASIPFLCYVLECYFDHKDLLQEYFQNMCVTAAN